MHLNHSFPRAAIFPIEFMHAISYDSFNIYFIVDLRLTKMNFSLDDQQINQYFKTSSSNFWIYYLTILLVHSVRHLTNCFVIRALSKKYFRLCCLSSCVARAMIMNYRGFLEAWREKCKLRYLSRFSSMFYIIVKK